MWYGLEFSQTLVFQHLLQQVSPSKEVKPKPLPPPHHGAVAFGVEPIVRKIPMLVVPQGGKGQNCSSTGCVEDLNGLCPSELRIMSSNGRGGIACKSACEAFRQPQYCCSGAYATPATCKPSYYSQVFKRACPRAYSYAYDDKTCTFTCANAADYSITFCPSPNTSQKSSQEATTPGQNTETTTTAMPTSPLVDNTIMYEGFLDESEASPFRVTTYIFGIITVAIWWWCQIF
ncbi:hypothetical protein V6Z11_A02G104200 [Gossypium hirsutum]